MSHTKTIIIGAGPAGLTAARELAMAGERPLVLEKRPQLGGISRTEQHNGYRVDVGGHRYYTQHAELQRLWKEVLGPELLSVQRRSRIFYRGRFFPYPLKAYDTLTKLGVTESALAFASYLKGRMFRTAHPETLEEWMVGRFGRRLYRMFFQNYTRKLWGRDGSKIRSDWAAQRIGKFSMLGALRNALTGNGTAKTLTPRFLYPRLGSGMMWEEFGKETEKAGGVVWRNAEVVELKRDGTKIEAVVVSREKGAHQEEIPVDSVLSTMPLAELIFRMNPAPPEEVVEAARNLHHRAFVQVNLILDKAEVCPDQWIYLPQKTLTAGRIQNFTNWSPALVPDQGRSLLGVEYFCDEGDSLWQRGREKLVSAARCDLERIGLCGPEDVIDGSVTREPHAYPVYSLDYHRHLDVVRGFLRGMLNLETAGRNGLHRYNNMDHSMLTGRLGVENLRGASHDLWKIRLNALDGGSAGE